MLVLPDRARPIRFVDRSKGIARGLVCAGLFNQPGGAYDLINGGRFDGTAGVGGLVSPSISSGAWHNKTLNAYTVCIWHGGFTFGSWGAVVASNDGTNRWVIQRYSTTTTMRIYHNATSHNFTDFTTDDCALAGMLVLRWDGTWCHAFYEAENIGSAGHAVVPGSSTTATLGFGNATVYQALVYGRALSDAEIIRLHRDPAAPLEKSRSRVAVLFLSAGGEVPLAGGMSGQSSVSAALAVARSLAGQVTAQGAVSGQVSVARPLAGSAQAQASMTGGLSVEKPLAGSIQAESSVAGGVVASRLLAGSIQAGSQVDGAVAVERGLSGAVAGQSGLSGTMSVTRALAGSVTAQAQTAGGLSATWAMAGSVEAASAAAASLTIEGQVALAGQLAAASSCAASLSVGRLLAGQVSGQTGMAGSLSLLGEQVALSGAISAQSGVSGALGVQRGLAGQLASTASVSGAVSAMRSLSAQLGGTVQVVGQVRADWALAGSMAAQADVSGSLAILGEVNLAGVFLFLKRKTR